MKLFLDILAWSILGLLILVVISAIGALCWYSPLTGISIVFIVVVSWALDRIINKNL